MTHAAQVADGSASGVALRPPAIKVATFTGGALVPSARFRVRQYLTEFAHAGIEVREFYPRSGTYPPAKRWIRPLWAAAALAETCVNVARSRGCDVTLFQREMISTLLTLEPLCTKPRILDVDDAIFLHRDGRAARRLAFLCDYIVCGNSYLAEWFARFNTEVRILPTAIDTVRFTPRPAVSGETARITIGWVGTSGNLRELVAIEPALRSVLVARPHAVLRIVCDRAPPLNSLPADRIEYVPWTQEREVSNLQSFDIGIMPLHDSPWTRGKCSFKMLQYMACGIPVVVSPVGMNAEVLALGPLGIGAATDEDWIAALISLIDDVRARAALGATGRAVAEKEFSIRALAPTFCTIIRDAAAAQAGRRGRA